MSLARGTRFGHYEIAALIGAGGMGEVYRATDTNLKRDVALKVLPDTLVTDMSRLARLQREAEVLAAVNHANIAQIHGLERSDGRLAIVMEFVDGSSLGERIARDALPPSEALDIALQIASALEAAHDRGIVHRDLKPQNIAIKPDGTVKVLDFGLAKALDASAISGRQSPITTGSMTAAGVVLGTAAYMSPEQARGKGVDRRTDVWAFGCVLYEMLTGKAAFGADDLSTTLARVLEREPDMRELPNGLSPFVRGTIELCLRKEVSKRLSHIGDVRLALEGEIATGSSARVQPQPMWRRAVPFAAVLVALAAGYYVASVLHPPPPVAEAAALPVTRFLVTPPPSAPLTNLPGFDMVISPGGERIAYLGQDPQTGGVALYVRELDDLEPRRLAGTEINDLTTGTLNPFFSRDGRSLGFSDPERGIMRVAVDGGPVVKMFDSPPPQFLGARWSPDDVITFATPRGLYRVSAGGGVPQLLVAADQNERFAAPALLPEGRGALFHVNENDTYRVFALDFGTGIRKVVAENGQNANYSDTGHLVFARGSTLMAAPFDLDTLAATGLPVPLLEGIRRPGPSTAADYQLSPSGTLAYVSGGDETTLGTRVGWVARNGEAAGVVVESDFSNSARASVLSPDGTHVLVTLGPGNDADLWSYDLSGRPPIRLAVAGHVTNPVWSPDGRQVVFARSDDSGENLYKLPADGSVGTPQPVRAEPIPGVAADWSLDDELFIVRSRNANSDILVLAADGAGDLREVVATEYTETDPDLSPDGRWLAYTSNRTGQDEIWAQRYPEGAPIRVSTNGGYAPRWSRDGHELFYRQARAVMGVAVESGSDVSFAAPVALFSGQYEPGPYDVAGDGRFLMISSNVSATRDSASIIVVQNWTEELRRRVPVP